ncbi:MULTISPECIES: adenylate kinase [Prochlorococcus]|uniref:Adenylate kinase n=3 Tax=Prochlorococcus marinus TaxID=1219 RepID=KAD_PROMA|nr:MULTISPECIES: adenylate kinase [Prochlorococcus]Q7V9Y1.1 RecName: Full=Adenylate kinase; Short=AK; AltName: Full=ATP-AMP transphosphorylase; AltName: Full=ATP:AMP phosphotransferase; AltName: Full=Adenylate monophosphate kinase [Prochlorococcus marinus subsp. marinus str. CCMP1375]AAQ00737.1 Adenylate kinase [Prochlorococcus marinus subsp. marinus str. CCMP1375]KGG10767.1 Adenylate kinase [Prochlorococcus marinus str. LG]KGG34793.1 Adenylate kinase [Prochlorococcus sp. SS52]
MKNRLLFLGPPGAGKGTQASLICKDQGFLHLSTGDLLREEVSGGTDLGKKAELIMNKGELVSDEIVISIVEKRLIKYSEGWLLDGFPRNLAQASLLQNLLGRISQPIEIVLLIEIDDEILTERMLGRGRKDDNKAVIKNRLKIYKDQTSPLVDHYKKQGILKSINGCGSVEDVNSRIKEALS